MKGDCTAAFEGGSCVDSEYKSTANEASTGMMYSFFMDPANECALNHAMAAFTGNGTAGGLAGPFQSMDTEDMIEYLAPPELMGTDIKWSFCASQWGVCSCPSGHVRYGIENTWYEETMERSVAEIDCTNDVFGDPKPGENNKRCECGVADDPCNEFVRSEAATTCTVVDSSFGKVDFIADPLDCAYFKDLIIYVVSRSGSALPLPWNTLAGTHV